MKRLTLLLAFVLCMIGATSCNKGDDPVPTKTNTPVTQEQGEWEVQCPTPKDKKPTFKPKPEGENTGTN